jgi:hypothetical protein
MKAPSWFRKVRGHQFLKKCFAGIRCHCGGRARRLEGRDALRVEGLSDFVATSQRVPLFIQVLLTTVCATIGTGIRVQASLIAIYIFVCLSTHAERAQAVPHPLEPARFQSACCPFRFLRKKEFCNRRFCERLSQSKIFLQRVT